MASKKILSLIPESLLDELIEEVLELPQVKERLKNSPENDSPEVVQKTIDEYFEKQKGQNDK